MTDLMPVMEGLISLVALMVLGAIPVALPAVLKRLRIANDSDLAKRIEVAATAAAGTAYQYALERIRAGGLSNTEVKDAAVDTGVNHVLRSLPDTLEALGISTSQVKSMVEARLGALQARDPMVTASPAKEGA